MSSELSAFEARLSKLAPAEALDRSLLMFRAGRAAEARIRRRWQMFTAAAVCLAAGAAMLNLVWPRTQVIERFVYVRQEASPPVPHPLVAAAVAHEPLESPWRRGEVSEFSYFRLRQQVLEHGLGALPTSSAGSGGAQDARRLMDALLRNGNVHGWQPI